MEQNELHTAIKSGKTLDLAKAWQMRVKALYGPAETPLTGKDIGQLRLLSTSLGPMTRQVIDWALDNWLEFSQVARSHAGLMSAPRTPHVGFLLVHRDVAVDLMAKAAASSPIPTK